MWGFVWGGGGVKLRTEKFLKAEKRMFILRGNLSSYVGPHKLLETSNHVIITAFHHFYTEFLFFMSFKIFVGF